MRKSSPDFANAPRLSQEAISDQWVVHVSHKTGCLVEDEIGAEQDLVELTERITATFLDAEYLLNVSLADICFPEKAWDVV